MELSEQVAQAANLLGLLLALDTLFTAEQWRRLSEQRNRVGGADSSVLRFVRLVALGLAAVTTAAAAALLPLFVDVVGAIGDDEWEPVLAVFELTWILLVALVVWQMLIVRQSRPRQ